MHYLVCGLSQLICLWVTSKRMCHCLNWKLIQMKMFFLWRLQQCGRSEGRQARISIETKTSDGSDVPSNHEGMELKANRRISLSWLRFLMQYLVLNWKVYGAMSRVLQVIQKWPFICWRAHVSRVHLWHVVDVSMNSGMDQIFLIFNFFLNF